METRSYFRSKRALALIWFAFLVGPVVWFLGLNVDYALVRLACAESNSLPLHAVTLVSLALVAVGGVVAWREWGKAGRQPPGEGGSEVARTRFMCAIGLFGSALFAVVIIAQWAGKLFLNPCMAI